MSPLLFFVLPYALGATLWIAALVFGGVGLPDGLSITDVGAVFMPTAACIPVYREGDWAG